MKTLLTYFLNAAVLSFTMNAYSQSGINKCYGFDHGASLVATAISSEFRGADVNLQNFNLGFSVGIKF